MRRLTIGLVILLAAAPALAQRKDVRTQELKKESSAAPDKSLAGDITRKKVEKAEAAPSLQYDQFRTQVELQVREKRLEQIRDLQKIIELTPDDAPEKPDLLFRMGELYFEETKHFFYEGNRQDDEYIRAMNRQDKAGMARAKEKKAELIAESKRYAKAATQMYATIVQNFQDYKRTDEVLYFLGHNLMEQGDSRRALVAFKRLIDKFQKPPSRFLPDAYLAFGEYYFLNSKGKRKSLERALHYYKLAEGFPENQAYAFAIYKQGWCYFNLGDYDRAMDKFKAVVLYAQFAGAAAVEKDGGKSGKGTLAREARADYVRAYANSGRSALDARAEFARLTDKEDEQWKMLKSLANLYYGDGKDKEAALTFNTLIKWRPLSPEAPGFQGKIVDCVLRAGNKKMTVDQVRRLVRIHTEIVKAGVIKTEKDKKAMEEAMDLAERTLSNLAVNWHNEAKKTRNDDTFVYAHEVYGDYLTLFPENKKAYDLRFFWAELLNDNLQRYDKSAEQYTVVLAQDLKRIEKGEKPGKWMVNAAYNAILAHDEVVRQAAEAGKLKSPDVSDPTKKAEMHPLRQALLDACLRYLKHLPKGEKAVEIAFKAAKLYYDHNHFEDSTKIFAEIATKHQDYKFENGDRASVMAANLILDTYNFLGDWAKVNEWSRRFFRDPSLATGDFKGQLSAIVEQSSFKLVNQMEAEKQYAKAAEAYLAFVAEFPRSDIAEKALFNASIDFFKAKMLDRAIEVRKRIISRYPKSEFVPACIYANAEAAEAIGDFQDAADDYEAYVRGYEKSKAPEPKRRSRRRRRARRPEPKKKEVQVWEESKAQVALFNAGVFREGLGQYRQALRNRERYLELWPKAKDADAVFLSIADLHESNGAWSRAMDQLEAYERMHKRDPNKVLMAEGRIATIYEKRLRRERDAQRLFKRIWDYYEDLPRRTQKRLDNVALDAVARAHLEQSQADWAEYTRKKLRWGRGRKLAQVFKESLQEKVKALGVVEKRYTQTVQFKAGEPAICALYRIGLAYHHMAESVINAPMPPKSSPELQDAIRQELSGQALPLRDKAAEAFAVTVQKAGELDIFNDCFKKSLALLREQYRPQQFPPMHEELVELPGVALASAVGQGVLTSIQPIPVISRAQAEVREEKAEALKDDLAGLEDVQNEPAGSGEPRGPPSSSASGDAEPEDSL